MHARIKRPCLFSVEVIIKDAVVVYAGAIAKYVPLLMELANKTINRASTYTDTLIVFVSLILMDITY